MNYARFATAILLALGVCVPAVSQTATLEQLQQRCESAREAKIAPLREAAIKDCASSTRSSRSLADCQRIHQDFGQGGGVVGGGFRAPMFIDLPQCVEFFEAQDAQRRDGSRR